MVAHVCTTDIELISEIQERARESKKAGHKLGANKTNKDAHGSVDPQAGVPKSHTAEEVAKLANTKI